MTKDSAINLAVRLYEKNERTFHVIHTPETYNDIFNNAGYKVVDDKILEDLVRHGDVSMETVVFSTNENTSNNLF